MDQTKITEIGISTLDTLDLINVPPGEGGAEWMKKIRYVQLGVFLFQSKNCPSPRTYCGSIDSGSTS